MSVNRTRLNFPRQFGASHHLERVTIVHANHIVVKFAELVGAIILQLIDISLRRLVNFPPPRCHRKFHHALEVTEIVQPQLVIGWEQHGAVMNTNHSLLEADADVHCRASVASRRLEGAVHQIAGRKVGWSSGRNLIRAKDSHHSFFVRILFCSANHCKPASGIISCRLEKS